MSRKWSSVIAAAAGALALVTGLSLTAAQAGSVGAHRPASSAVKAAASSAKYPVTPFSQEFQQNTSGFCGDPTIGHCDGAVDDYGTIDRVPSGFSNGGTGNYAPSTSALVGGWFALTSGTQAVNEGKGCPSTATEYCTGPYALFGTGAAAGRENVFPAKGFTVTDDLYLSPATAPAGGQVDDDIGLNDSAGSYGRDNIITACPVTGGYAISFGSSSPGTCGTTPVVTGPGWYRFVFIFSNLDGGHVYVQERVVDEATGAVIANSGNQPEEFVGATSAEPVSAAGGPGYFWLPTENVSGLPLANVVLQLGDHIFGSAP